MKANKDKGEVEIHGKVYLTVARRIKDFRDSERYEGWSITTKRKVTTGSLVEVRAVIKDETNRVIATGMAEEDRAFGKINKTSALENAETSAVGRALAFLGLGGSEIASADEVSNAIVHGSAKDSVDPILNHNKALAANLSSVYYIKECIAREDMLGVAEGWNELDNNTKEALWLAPTKGGIFTTEERQVLKSDEFFKARKEVA
tara:strand:- start:1994 stop:2605 length:612 start_codon:yes stop_codon:yes gene_type:complete